MKRPVFCAAGAIALVAAAGLVAPKVFAAPASAPTQFSTAVVMTELKDGQPVVVAQPHLITNEGQEGSFLAGGEAPVGDGTNDVVPFGVQARVKVRQIAATQLRVSLHASHSNLDTQGGAGGTGNFVIREIGVRCVKTIKPGEKIEVDLGDGRTMVATVKPVSAPAAR
jgi:Flp pilus assembly secretin CpaC